MGIEGKIQMVMEGQIVMGIEGHIKIGIGVKYTFEKEGQIWKGIEKQI